MSLAASPRSSSAPREHAGKPALDRLSDPSTLWVAAREGVHTRLAVEADAGPIRDFLITQYDAFNATDNTVEGHRVFRDFVSVPALRGRLRAGSLMLLAERRGAILGVCEMHRDGYLTLLYVDGGHQGRGLGRLLVGMALRRLRAEAPDLRMVRVRAMPYARGFYTHLGFRPLRDGLRDDRGLRFYPLALDLDRV
jgi:ribosomal protein S18 acetylase RimI-like enzyme